MRTIFRWMFSIFVLAGLAPLPSEALAGKKSAPLFEVLGRSAGFDGAARTAKRGRELTGVELVMPLAVALDDDLPDAIGSQVGVNEKSSAKSGSIMFSSPTNRNLYCGSMASRSLGKAGPCLIDVDGDGRFEGSVKAGAMAKSPAGMGISNNWLLGANFGPTIALPSPLRYHHIASDLAPHAQAFLAWQSDFKASRPGPVKILFSFVAPNDWQGTNMVTAPETVSYIGSPVEVRFGGLTVVVDSIAPNGELHYRLSGKMQDVPLDFNFQDRVMNFIYIAR